METKEFIAILSILQSATGLTEPYGNVLFCEDSIKAFNGSTGIIIQYETGIEGGLLVDPLIKTLKSLKGEELTITQKKRTSEVSSEKGERIKLIPNVEVEKFFPFEYDEGKFRDLPDNFQDALGLCSLTTGGPVLKEFVQGVYFLDDEAVSTNDAAVSRVAMEDGIDTSLFIHNYSIPILLKTVPIGFKLEEKSITFNCGDDMQVVCPIYDYSDFPYPYEKLLSGFGKEYELPQDFHYAVKKASSALYGVKTKLSLFTFTEGKLTIKSRSKAAGILLEDTIEVDTEFEDNFYLDPELLTKYHFCKTFSVNETGFRVASESLGAEIVLAKTLK